MIGRDRQRNSLRSRLQVRLIHSLHRHICHASFINYYTYQRQSCHHDRKRFEMTAPRQTPHICIVRSLTDLPLAKQRHCRWNYEAAKRNAKNKNKITLALLNQQRSQHITYINRYAWQRKHLCRWHVTWNISIEFVAVFVPFDRVQHLVVERIMAFQAGRTIAYGVIGNANLGQSQCKRQACV